jgi:MFS family permease
LFLCPKTEIKQASLDLTIITTAIPKITEQFHSLADVGWYGSAMSFPVAATQSFWGKCFKYYPMKIVFLVSIFVFEIGSLVCGKLTFLVY